MTFDESFYDYYEGDDSPDGDPRGYTRVHALRALERMGEAAEVAIKRLMPLMNDEDDWIAEEMPVFYGYMGRPAIEPLKLALDEGGVDTSEDFRWGSVPRALEQIAQRHPELRDEVLSILEQGLVTVANPTIAGLIVCSLMDVEAKESLEIIRQAFEDDRIDETIVDFIGVEESFGLREKRKWDLPPMLLPPSLKPRESSARNRSGDTYQQPFMAEVKVGRNEPCLCGSGKKYKKCCGA